MPVVFGRRVRVGDAANARDQLGPSGDRSNAGATEGMSTKDYYYQWVIYSSGAMRNVPGAPSTVDCSIPRLTHINSHQSRNVNIPQIAGTAFTSGFFITNLTWKRGDKCVDRAVACRFACQ
jgi:hypothetical protein